MCVHVYTLVSIFVNQFKIFLESFAFTHSSALASWENCVMWFYLKILAMLNEYVNIGGWTIVFPLRLPLFFQLPMMNVCCFYIRENYLEKKAWLLSNSPLVCQRGNRVNSGGITDQKQGLGSGTAMAVFLPSKIPFFYFYTCFSSKHPLLWKISSYPTLCLLSGNSPIVDWRELSVENYLDNFMVLMLFQLRSKDVGCLSWPFC